MGVTVDYHPPLDLRVPGAHDVIGDRALGTEPMRVAALGRATLDGLARAGVAGVVKHMPGHGRSMVDSHKETPLVTASAQELETDLAPFRALRDAPIAMTGHLRFAAWDAENPATHSAFVVQEIIRKAIGFDGLLLTDDLDMEALGGSVPETGAGPVETPAAAPAGSTPTRQTRAPAGNPALRSVQVRPPSSLVHTPRPQLPMARRLGLVTSKVTL